MKNSPYKIALRKAYKKGYNSAYHRLKRAEDNETVSIQNTASSKPSKRQIEIQNARDAGFRDGRAAQEERDKASIERAKMVQEKTEARIKVINSIGQLAQQMSHLAEAAYRLVEEIHN